MTSVGWFILGIWQGTVLMHFLKSVKEKVIFVQFSSHSSGIGFPFAEISRSNPLHSVTVPS